MPTITLTLETLYAFGVSRADLEAPTLPDDAKRSLEAMLASRGFDVTDTVRVVVLPNGEGAVLTQ